MNEKKSFSPAVVLGQSPTALYAIRELGRAGIKVYGEIIGDSAISHSRYISGSRVNAPYANTEQRLDFLLNKLPAEIGQKPVLIPCSDQDVDFVCEHAELFAEKYLVQPALRSGLAAYLMDKDNLYKECAENQLNVPGCWTREPSELKSLVGELRFPCLIKPSKIHAVKKFMAGKKLWTLESEAEYIALIERLPAGDTSWIVQELIPGPESEIWVYCANYDNDGVPRQSFTARKLRQYPPGFGSASLVRSEANPELVEVCEHLFKALEYKGIAAAEFKRDPRDGALKIIEINPRPSLWFGVSTAAGKQVVLSAYNDAAGLPQPEDNAQKNGVYWRYLLKDLYSKAFYIFNKDFILPPPCGLDSEPASLRVGAVYAADDPKPVIGELSGIVKKVISRVGKGS